MYKFLEMRYHLTGADDLGAALGELALLPDGMPADPAAWEDWEKAVQIVRSGRADISLKLGPDAGENPDA